MKIDLLKSVFLIHLFCANALISYVRGFSSRSYRSMRSLCLHDNKRNWSPVSPPSQEADNGDEETGIAYSVEMGKSCGIR